MPRTEIIWHVPLVLEKSVATYTELRNCCGVTQSEKT